MRFLCKNFTRYQICSATIPSNQKSSIAQIRNWNQNYSTSVSVLPNQSQVIIAGAGVVGNSIAYHLSKDGRWKDVCVIEENCIGSNASNFGSGILGQFKPISMRNLIKASIDVYQEVERKGYNIGFQRCGSLNLAQTENRMIAIKRRMAYNIPTGLHCELLSADEIQRKHPLINTERLLGGVWVPDDSIADPHAICHAMAELAQLNGVDYHEHCSVERVNTDDNRVCSVETNRGTIKCEYFVNCGGMWSRQLGLKSKPPVVIPTYAAYHFYAIASGGDQLSNHQTEALPIVRDYDARTYFRQYGNGNNEMFIGWFERDVLTDVDENWNTDDLTDNDRKLCEPLWERAVHRMPTLGSCEFPLIHKLANNFTPDGRWILGEAADVKNYFVAVGMNGNSLQCAGGIGKAVAEWLIEGSPTQALQTFSLQRFLDLHNNRRYLQQRTKEVVDRHYQILYPNQCEYKFARKLRCSPLYSVLERRGAVFGTIMAYERALFFDTTYKWGDKLPEMPSGSFYKPKFLDFMQEEYAACREGVGLIDMSSFSKIEIRATKDENSVLDYLQIMCSNDINVPIGGIVHTGMQNERGGYENDCIIVRQSNEKFYMVSPSEQQTRIYQWMNEHLPKDGSVCLTDVTSMYTVINVVGPKALPLLSELSNSHINLLPFHYQKINVAYASDVMVMSYTHTGEPGYCLHIPSEYALHVYDKLLTIGRDFGVRDVGTFTQRFMRIERFIPFWNEELNNFITPYETGYGYQVQLNKDFIGKAALQKQRENGVHKRLVMFHLDGIDPDKDVWPWGGEPMFRDNEFVGTVTSAGYSFPTHKIICMGFVRLSDNEAKRHKSSVITKDYILNKAALYEINIAGKRFPMRPFIHVSRGSITLPRDANLSSNSLSSNSSSRDYKPTVVKFKKILPKSAGSR